MREGVSARPQTAADLIVLWTQSLSARNYKPSTLKQYPLAARNWVEFLDTRKKRYDNADYDDVDAFLTFLTDQGIDPTTRKCKSSAIRQFYKFLKRRHYVTDNPFDCTESIRVERPLPSPLTEAQAKAIIEGEPHPLWRAMWEVFYATGARISSVMDLTPESVFLDDARVLFATGKRGRKRVLALTRPAVLALRTYIEWRSHQETESPWLWIGQDGRERMHPDNVRDQLRRAAKRVGITERVNPHRWRHSLATHMLEHGADLREVQEQLGHVSIQATQIYTEVSAKRLEEVLRKSHPRA